MDGLGGVSITRGGNDHSSAIIASVDPTSGGIYMCKAINSLGSSEVNYIVHVLGKFFSYTLTKIMYSVIIIILVQEWQIHSHLMRY